jgi:hypothetical protein
MFMARDGAIERLAVGKATEVERGAPTVLIQISGEVVVAMEKVSLQLSA